MSGKYTNSSLVTYTKLSPNKNSPRKNAIDRITIHCIVGQLEKESIGAIFANPEYEASCNYAIDTSGEVALIVEESDRSWCSSNRDNDNRAVTIECASDMKEPYAVNKKVYATLIDLCADICQRNGKKKLLWFGDREKTLGYTPADDEMIMTVHRWFAKKSCPGQYLYDRHAEIAEEVTKRLNPKLIDNTNVTTVYSSIEKRYNQLSDMPKYCHNTIKKLIDKGYLNGKGSVERDEEGYPTDLDLSLDMIRMFVINDRAHIYDK